MEEEWIHKINYYHVKIFPILKAVLNVPKYISKRKLFILSEIQGIVFQKSKFA